MTDHRLFVVTNPTKGMDGSAYSHVVGLAAPDTWSYVKNFRMENGELVYVPGEKKRVTYTDLGLVVMGIVPVIQPGATEYNVLLLTEKDASFLTDETGEVLASQLPIDGSASNTFEFDSLTEPAIFFNFQRWSYTIYGGYVFFTNLLNKVQVFRYNSASPGYEIRTLDDSDPTVDPINVSGNVDNLMPKAKYICVYEGHIVCAHTREDYYWDGNSEEPLPEETTYNNRVRWSQRDVLGQALYDWFPGTGSNADFKDLSSSGQFSEFGAEITGMNILRNVVVLYTRSAIYSMTYVGLPSIMRFQQQINVGCHFPYSVAVGVDVHFFIGIDGIYAFNGSSIQNIGTKIWNTFRQLIHSNRAVAEKTWSWVRASQHQVWWFFISKDAYATWCFDTIMIYDWVYDTWTFQRARSPFSACELNSAIEGEDTIIRALLYGSGYGTILAELDFDSNPADLDFFNQAVLISQDIQFEDPEAVKEITTFYIDAELDALIVEGESASGVVYWGIGIYACTREYTSDPVNYFQVGMWTRFGDSEYTDGRPRHIPLDIRVSGRIINFALVPMVHHMVTDEDSENPIQVLFEKEYANV